MARFYAKGGSMNPYKARMHERYVAVDNVCAWPNIKLLPSGEVGAFIYNRPSHGKEEGDIELWVSNAGSSPWKRKSVVTAHVANTVRMNAAAGILSDGTVVCLCSGWDLTFQNPVRTQNILDTIQICRSDNGGESWSRYEAPITIPSANRLIPFGNIVEGHGTLAVGMYDCRMSNENRLSRLSSSHMFTSDDRGVTWNRSGTIGADCYTETDILPIEEGWLAAARTLADYANPDDPMGKPSVKAIIGNASGDTWSNGQNLTIPDQHPGNLLRLKDGRILFTCGSRINGFLGVFARISIDEGRSWSDPFILIDDCLSRDSGYPSTVELENGNFLTAYYVKASTAHNRYHMATVIWNFT